MYWDASALVPLFVVEPGSESVRTWLSEVTESLRGYGRVPRSSAP